MLPLRDMLINALAAFLLAVLAIICISTFSGCWARNGLDFDAHLRPVKPDEQKTPDPQPKPRPLRPRK